MDPSYQNVIIRDSSDATVNGIPVEMVAPTNVYSSVFQHPMLISRQLGSPVLVRGADETKGGQVAWFMVDADRQAAAAEPVLIPVPNEHATGEPGFTVTPESQPPLPVSTSWAPPPGDGSTPPIDGWTFPVSRRVPVGPLPVEEALINPISSPAQTVVEFDRGAPEARPPAIPGRARGPEPPGFSTALVPLNASPPSIPQVPVNASSPRGQGFAPRG